MVKPLSKDEEEILDAIYKILGEGPLKSSQVGFDEIADDTDYTDEEIKERCIILAEKGWLEIGESDVYYDKKKEKQYFDLKAKKSQD